MTIDLFDRRAVLFLPASNPRAVAKARASGADMVILDLEDAVKNADKDAARDEAVAAVAEAWPMPVGIRVNGVGSMWHDADVAAITTSRAAFVVVPMVSAGSLLSLVRERCGKPVLAMIESAAGVLAAPAIAREAAGLIMGCNGNM